MSLKDTKEYGGPLPPNHKICNHCETPKHFREFYPTKAGKYFRDSVCKKCRVDYQKDYNLRKREERKFR